MIQVALRAHTIKNNHLMEMAIEGKTYSLFGESQSTQGYYAAVRALADDLLTRESALDYLLSVVRRLGRYTRSVQGKMQRFRHDPLARYVFEAAEKALASYTVAAEVHLASFSWKKLWDSTLRTTRPQYHLAMLEIELFNRLNRPEFLGAVQKVAFLPYCLHDLARECKSVKDGLDYRCKACSKNCYIHAASQVLKVNGVEAYLLMETRLNRLLRTARQSRSMGVLGIACVPELIHGMRLCQRHHVPVVGLPLSANRCKRWMGTFHDNSINLPKLESIISLDVQNG